MDLDKPDVLVRLPRDRQPLDFKFRSYTCRPTGPEDGRHRDPVKVDVGSRRVLVPKEEDGDVGRIREEADVETRELDDNRKVDCNYGREFRRKGEVDCLFDVVDKGCEDRRVIDLRCVLEV